MSAASSLQQDKNIEFAQKLEELGEGLHAASVDAAEGKAAALAAGVAADRSPRRTATPISARLRSAGPPPSPAEAEIAADVAAAAVSEVSAGARRRTGAHVSAATASRLAAAEAAAAAAAEKAAAVAARRPEKRSATVSDSEDEAFADAGGGFGGELDVDTAELEDALGEGVPYVDAPGQRNLERLERLLRSSQAFEPIREKDLAIAVGIDEYGSLSKGGKRELEVAYPVLARLYDLKYYLQQDDGSLDPDAVLNTISGICTFMHTRVELILRTADAQGNEDDIAHARGVVEIVRDPYQRRGLESKEFAAIDRRARAAQLKAAARALGESKASTYGVRTRITRSSRDGGPREGGDDGSGP